MRGKGTAHEHRRNETLMKGERLPWTWDDHILWTWDDKSLSRLRLWRLRGPEPIHGKREELAEIWAVARLLGFRSTQSSTPMDPNSE